MMNSERRYSRLENSAELEKITDGLQLPMRLFRKVNGFAHNDREFLCCFRELHCKTACFAVNVLNSFLFCILTVQTIFSNDKQHFDFYAILVQGFVIISTFYALPHDKHLLLIPVIIFWVIISLLFSILIAITFAYALHPTGFPDRPANEFRETEAQEKLGMIRGVALMGMGMLSVVFAASVWFILIHIRTYQYIKKLRDFEAKTKRLSAINLSLEKEES